MKKLFSYVVLFSCLLLLTSITVFAVTAPNVQYSDVATYSASYYSSVSGKTADAAFDLLCEWSESDPVDGLEITRNNYAASVTGLRNPFIDHPEFADMIWDESYNGGGPLDDDTTNVDTNNKPTNGINSGYRTSGSDVKHFVYKKGSVVYTYTVKNTTLHTMYVTMTKMKNAS